MKILKYNDKFSTYEYIYATICLHIYLDLLEIIKPTLVCYTPTYHEILIVLNEMLSYLRIYKLGNIFVDPRKAKPQTIRGYISQRAKIDHNKIASLLYTGYINRPTNDIALIGNRKKVLSYIARMVKDGDVTYLGKEKVIEMFQLEGEPKMVTKVEILIATKLRSVI